jgi:hypothetical protein
MSLLRQALALLVDESLPIANRLDRLYPRKGPAMVPSLGPAILTATLHVAYPDRYGVLNGTTRAGLDHLELSPNRRSTVSTGQEYESINAILHQLAAALRIDLWTLDSL